MNEKIPGDKTKGVLLGLAAYFAWGLMPLYFSIVREVPPLELLFHRIVWSFVFLLLIVYFSGKTQAFKDVWKRPVLLRYLVLSAFLIACNWFIYIISVSTKQVQQASIGYYLSPIISILLGRFALQEPMKLIHWISLIIAFAGAAHITFLYGSVPILALGLAITFSSYGLLRKVVAVDSIIGLATETSILFPISLIGILIFPKTVLIISDSGNLAIWVGMSGFITILPLLLFSAAASRVSLVSMGFFQYISPTIQFLIAIFLLDEKWDHAKLPGFIMIWFSLVLFSFESFGIFKKSKKYENIAD